MVDGPRWSHWRRCARLDYLEYRRLDEDLGEQGPINGWQLVGGRDAWGLMRQRDWSALGSKHMLDWSDIFVGSGS